MAYHQVPTSYPLERGPDRGIGARVSMKTRKPTDRPLHIPGGKVLVGIELRTVKIVARVLLANVKFAKDKARRLYYFDGTVYKEDIDCEVLRELYKDFLAQHGREDLWNDVTYAKVIKFIMSEIPMLHDKPDLNRINVRNGVCYLGEYDKVDECSSSARFESHEDYDHSDYLTTVQIPIYYNPNETCLGIEEIYGQFFKEDPELLFQLVGICLIPFVGLQKCIVIVGPGSNGKSVFAASIRYILGPENCANLEMDRISGPYAQFSRALIQGKLVNLAEDNVPVKLLSTGFYKALISGDTVTLEIKGKQAYSYEPFTRLWFFCNEMWESDDKSVGYKRRTFLVPFTETFDVDAEKQKQLHRILSDPRELSGLLNRVLALLPKILVAGIGYNEEAAEKIKNYVPSPKYFKDWIGECITAGDNVACSHSALQASYTTEIPGDVDNRSDTYMMKVLRATFPNIRAVDGWTKAFSKKQNQFVHVRQRCYLGIGLIKVIDPKAQVTVMGYFERDDSGNEVYIPFPPDSSASPWS